MDLTCEPGDGCVLVRVRGRLDRWTAGQLDETLQREIAARGASVVLDCTQLEYVSSAGLRVILGAVKALRPAGRSVVLFGMAAMVREVFEIAGFTDFLAIHADEAAAVAAARKADQCSK